MFRQASKQFFFITSLAVLTTVSILIFGGSARAQETGGELSGGAGIFRPKNPEAKRSTNPSKPVVRPNRPTR